MVEGFFKTQTQSETKVKLNWKKGGGAVQVKSPQKNTCKERERNKIEMKKFLLCPNQVFTTEKSCLIVRLD